MTAIAAADLRPVDLFDDLADEELEEWAAVAQIREVADGELVAEQGQAPIGVILLLEGTMQTFLVERDRTEPVGRQEAPTWIGAISVLTRGTLGVQLRASSPCRIAVIAPDAFERLTLSHPAVHRRVMRQVAPVLSRLTSIEQSRERLASLGTMAAGLAHELNNPAAAARRAAAQVTEAVDVMSSTLRRFVDAGLEREQAQQLAILQQEALDAAASQTALDALDAADAEDALRDRLEDLGVPEAWRLAEPLAAAGVDEAWVERVVDHAGAAAHAALAWVAATLTARSLAADLQESTARMSSLVGAVKSYAYMDRGDLVEVDLHEGLETTLAVLAHKLKHTSIAVQRDYDRELPRLTVRGSELNQVWTNLLDNAIDAVGEQGTITIVTRRDGHCARVEIHDDGPGVPAELRERLFDAFVTSKDVGQGTGLGLATARRVVVDRHDGSIAFDSRPGATTFRVSLPFTQNQTP
jgi:signal transduction histidine kinase